jgi:hypothetical protein
MWLDGEQWLLLIAGLSFSILGGLVVFSNRFLAMMQKSWWNEESKFDKALFPNGAYFFNRYGRGLGALIFGVGLLWFFFQSLWK